MTVLRFGEVRGIGVKPLFRRRKIRRPDPIRLPSCLFASFNFAGDQYSPNEK